MNYFDIRRISNSALSCIDPETGGHPEKYRDFLDGKFHQDSPSMKLGDIIHRHLLLNEDFVTIDRKPGEALVKILDEYFLRLRDYGQKPFNIISDKSLLLQIIRSNGYYNNRKDETIIDGVIKEGEEYFSFLLKNNGKPVIPSEWKDILEKLSLSILRETIQAIFNPFNKPGNEILSEFEILFDLKAKSYHDEPETFECKSKIDRLILNHINKTYRIIDLKSTSSPIESFSDSVKRYKYHRQLAFYLEAVKQIMPEGYVEDGIYILAVETIGYCRARLFKLNQDTLISGKQDYCNLLKRVSYHAATLNWIYPMEEEMNQGIYQLNMAL